MKAALGLFFLASICGAEGLVNPQDMPGQLKEVRFDQNLGAELPLDAPFVDENGKSVVLGDFFGERPVVLAFVYYECPMLCSLIMNGLAKSLAVTGFEIGREIDVVAISFDPDEGPEMARQTEEDTLLRYGHVLPADLSAGGDAAAGEGWHFLTGDRESIDRVTQAAGFAYTYLPEDDEYAHTSGIVIVTPEGEIAQYFFGIEYPPKDVRLALVEASSGRIGSVVDQVLLYCFRFDPDQGKYTAATLRILRLLAAICAFAVVGYVFLTWRRERSRVRSVIPISGGAA